MESLTVKKINETFLEIECEASTERELSEHFCFYVPGYKFMPAYRNRMWDGKIRLFDTRTKRLYCGLLHYLKEFATEREYSIHVDKDNGVFSDETLSQIDLQKFVSQINLCVQGKGITPREYQTRAIYQCISEQKTLLLSPTASGKSLIIYLAMRYFLQNTDENEINLANKVLIIVPTTSLVEQLYADFGDYSSKDTWNHIQHCHRIYSGKERYNIKKRIVISTWQSIHKMKSNWFEDYGMVIGDEAHNFKAKSLIAIMEKCINAKYRMGTTGTLDGTQTHQLVLEGLFGPLYRVTTTKKLMDQKNLAQMKISVLLLKYKDEYRKEISKTKYQEELDFIVKYTPRNTFISNLALDQKGNTLILFQYVDKHGKPLYELLSKKISKNRKLFYVSGETHVDTREKIRSITEKENDAIIVASIGTFSTGINIVRLHNLIFASPSKSQIRVLQSIGRGLRVSGDDINTNVYDIADDLQWKTKKNYTLNHAAERIKIYAKEKFKYNIYPVKI
jgi:superfamily II DNA or RNA helicase